LFSGKILIFDFTLIFLAYFLTFEVLCLMSFELKAILGSVAAENDAHKRAMFDEGLSR
jgi:hypothetical protein